MNAPNVVLLSLALLAGAHAFCYDAAVAKDQAFDDSFVCNDVLSYPGQYIEPDVATLYGDPATVNTAYFLDTATTCFNETSYFTQAYAAAGDYAYQCVCPSSRKRIDKVYLNQKICFVVNPEKQDIQYAQCRTHCTFDYGTKIATASRGYYCVNQNFVQREFLVWCPTFDLKTPVPLTGGSYGKHPSGYVSFGSFHRLTYNLPSLCSCRGYFCEDHSAMAG